jgi:hypothetical protein
MARRDEAWTSITPALVRCTSGHLFLLFSNIG